MKRCSAFMLKHCLTIFFFGLILTSDGQTLQDIEKRLKLLEDLPEYGQLNHIKFDTTGFSKLPPFDYFCDDENENKLAYYKVIDLNKDGRDDLIYSGPCMPYSETGIFLNKGDRLDLIHSYPGEVLSIEQLPDRAIVQVLKWPCCCDTFFDYYEIAIYHDSRVGKNLISFESDTKITLGKLRNIKAVGTVRSAALVNDIERKDDCTGKVIKGNHLTQVSKLTEVIQLNECGQWRLILYNESKTQSWIGWIKLK